jgi:hypothetical protein
MHGGNPWQETPGSETLAIWPQWVKVTMPPHRQPSKIKKQAAAIQSIRKWAREALQFYSVIANHGALP